jgi:hypothetical protein
MLPDTKICYDVQKKKKKIFCGVASIQICRVHLSCCSPVQAEQLYRNIPLYHGLLKPINRKQTISEL